MESIALRVLAHAQAAPDRAALIVKDVTYTYAHLAGGARSVAQWLTDRGIRPGQRVVVQAAHTFAYMATCYGVELLRAVFVPLEHNAPPDRIAQVAREVDAALVVTQELCDGTGAVAMPDAWKEISSCGSSYQATPPGADELAEILYTTGTTGKSKGVMVTFGNQAAMAQAGIDVLDLRPDNVWLIPTPMNHAAGLRKAHMSMYCGGVTCLLDGLANIGLYFDTIARHNVTSLYLPPSAIHVLLLLAPDALAKLDGQLRFIYSSASAYPQVDKDKMRKLLPSVRMYNVYGMSESGLVCTLEFNHGADKPNSIGRPHAMAKISILDGESREIPDSGPDKTGYLAIQSAQVTPGYWNEPELTLQTLRHGVLHTSDYGYIDPDGDIILLGRSGDVINLGGQKIAPIEVEAVALAIEGVDECVLIPVRRRAEVATKLLVVMKPGFSFDAGRVRTGLARHLEGYKVPRYIEEIQEIKKTYNGKIDRKAMQTA